MIYLECNELRGVFWANMSNICDIYEVLKLLNIFIDETRCLINQCGFYIAVSWPVIGPLSILVCDWFRIMNAILNQSQTRSDNGQWTNHRPGNSYIKSTLNADASHYYTAEEQGTSLTSSLDCHCLY